MFLSLVSSNLRRTLLESMVSEIQNAQFELQEGQLTLDVALVLLSACIVGTNPKILADFTNLALCNERPRHLRRHPAATDSGAHSG
jgi:hypothetical protein